MIRHAVALRYAKALFQIDQKNQHSRKRIEEFEHLFALCKKQPKFLSILESPLVIQEEKEALLKSTLKGCVDSIFLNFLCYLTKKRRLRSLHEILVEYQILADFDEHVWEAELVSGVAVQQLPRQDLVAKLEKFYGKKIVLNAHIEPKILGGTFLILGNKLLDWSVKSRLEKLETHLLGLDICR